MEIPKPGSWIKQPAEKPKQKRTHVLKPHLTDKPFKNDPRLAALKKGQR